MNYTEARAKYGSIPFMKRIYKKQDEVMSVKGENHNVIDADDFALMVSSAVNYLEEQKEILETSMETSSILKNKLLEAEQENIALKLRILKLQDDSIKDKETINLLQIELEGEKSISRMKDSGFHVIAKLKDDIEERANKAEKEVKRLNMLLDELRDISDSE